jgi:hypothetical protein
MGQLDKTALSRRSRVLVYVNANVWARTSTALLPSEPVRVLPCIAHRLIRQDLEGVAATTSLGGHAEKRIDVAIGGKADMDLCAAHVRS